MGVIVQNFSPVNNITINLAGAAPLTFVTSLAINNNSSNNYISATIQVALTAGTGGVANGNLIFYIIRSVDGTSFDNIDDNLQVLGVFNVDGTAGGSYVFSMDTAPTGTLPVAWGLAVFNNTGSTLASGSAAYCGKTYYAL